MERGGVRLTSVHSCVRAARVRTVATQRAAATATTVVVSAKASQQQQQRQQQRRRRDRMNGNSGNGVANIAHVHGASPPNKRAKSFHGSTTGVAVAAPPAGAQQHQQQSKRSKKKGKQDTRSGGGGACHVQVLGLGTDVGDTVPSLLVFTETRRYILNCGEGFQRYCGEHKVKLAKMSSILLTRPTVEAAGGFPGLCLSMVDVGGAESDALPTAIMGAARSNIEVTGPPGVNALMRYARSFVGSKLEIRWHELGNERGAAAADATSAPIRVLDDGNMTILASVLHPAAAAAAHSHDIKASCMYYFKMSDTPGKFDPVKATELGIPSGPVRAKLVRGEPITLADGVTVIHPDQCVGPTRLGARILVVDCPTPDHVEELTRVRMAAFEEQDEAVAVAAVFHITPPSVMKSEAYARWMQDTFSGENTKHVACIVDVRSTAEAPIVTSAPESTGTNANAETDALEIESVFCASSRLQAKLNMLDDGIFPLRRSSDVMRVASDGDAVATVAPPATHVDGGGGFPLGVVRASNLLRYHLRPENVTGFDHTSVPLPVQPSVVQDEIRNDISEITSLLADMKSSYGRFYENSETEVASSALRVSRVAKPPISKTDTSIPSALRSLVRGEAELLFLGTGAAAPSKYRNVSGLYLSTTTDDDGMMMDCGEGTLGQLRRRFGVRGADERIKKLKLIWVSHIHADHHVGLPSLLLARKRLLSGGDAPCPPITVIGPKPLRHALSILDHHFDLRMSFVDCWETVQGITDAPPSTKSEVLPALDALGLRELKSVSVIHCAHAFACQLEHQKGWKIVYSADTRPCQQVIESSKDATLLVHEATFEDELINEALARRHSIIREAVEVGAKAGAYRTLLTHFSQRYPKIPDLHGSYMDDRTCIAFDMMHVDLLDLPKLPMLMPPLSALFRDEALDQEEDRDVDDDEQAL